MDRAAEMAEHMGQPRPSDNHIPTQDQRKQACNLLDEWTDLGRGSILLLLNYVCALMRRDEYDLVEKALLHHVDLTGVYLIRAILENPNPEPVVATTYWSDHGLVG
jgi:hypothetical protein